MPPVWIPNYEKTIDRLLVLENRRAERLVAEALNKITSSDVWVFHSLNYSKSLKDKATIDYEIDFLVVWKDRGFLILEVKGGRIEFDPIENRWYRNPKDHPRQKYDVSPVEQLKRQRDDLCRDKLDRFFPSINSRHIVERALVFPDVNRSDFKDQQGLRPHSIDGFEMESIVDHDMLPNLASFVEKKLEPCAIKLQQHRIHSKVFLDIVYSLQPSVRAEVHPKHILECAESSIKKATDEQKEHLACVIGNPFLQMVGPAGSAKTVLGLSAVLSWAESGENAYYITANRYLVEGLRKKPEYSALKDRILTIHDFLEMTLGAKFSYEDDGMLQALAEWACASNGLSLVIDEAQDLNEELYEGLVSLLPYDRLWVLRDSHQSLERQNDIRRYNLGSLEHTYPFKLDKNCRNVQKIARYVARYVDVSDKYVNKQLEEGDREPDVIIVDSQESQDRKLRDVIRQGEKEGHRRDDIVVISCHQGGSNAVRNKYCAALATFGGIFSYGGEDPSKVAIFHALDFRGLESPYVIVTDIQSQESVFRANYLAGSRAKCRLTMIRVDDRQRGPSQVPKGVF